MSDNSERPARAPTYRQPPEHLGVQGLLFWEDIAGNYELRPDELKMLGLACSLLDNLDRIEAELRTTGLTVQDKVGEKAHPLLVEARQQSAVAFQIIRGLKIPDTPGGRTRKSIYTSQEQREKAHKRWELAGKKDA